MRTYVGDNKPLIMFTAVVLLGCSLSLLEFSIAKNVNNYYKYLYEFRMYFKTCFSTIKLYQSTATFSYHCKCAPFSFAATVREIFSSNYSQLKRALTTSLHYCLTSPSKIVNVLPNLFLITNLHSINICCNIIYKSWFIYLFNSTKNIFLLSS